MAWGGCSDFQPIAERVDSQQMTRLGRLVFDLLAQLHDQLIERAGGAVVVDAPDFVQEGFAGNGIAAFATASRLAFRATLCNRSALWRMRSPSVNRSPRRPLARRATSPRCPQILRVRVLAAWVV